MWSKHVEFYSKNKFEKLVHLVGFIIRMDHVVRREGFDFPSLKNAKNWIFFSHSVLTLLLGFSQCIAT